MVVSVLKGFLNIHKSYKTEILNLHSGNNRANNMGDGLEEFIKNLIANSFGLDPKQHKSKHQSTFAYEGSKTHPPDIIIRNGDALEIKKIENISSSTELQLNSSSPKKILKSTNPLITRSCRESDGGTWKQKDLFYVIGYIVNNALKGLFFVDGKLIAAEELIYKKVQESITQNLKESDHYQLSDTKELARINGIDPLKISNLRVRGMWLLKNPLGVFNYLDLETDNEFFAYFLCPKNKYLDMLSDSEISNKYKVTEVGVKNPDNPAEDITSILVSYTV